MITELIVKSALEAVIGQGFKAAVERVFDRSVGKSDREILEAIVIEVQGQGGQIGNLSGRVAQLEFEILRLQSPGNSYQPYAVPLPPPFPVPSNFQDGKHFKGKSGGYMNHFNRSRKT